MLEPTNQSGEPLGMSRAPGQPTTADLVRSIVRFLRTLRYHKSHLIISLAIVGSLGTLYYLTATRIYQATASLLVTPQNPGKFWNAGTNPDAGQDALIPTYERLFSSAVILKNAATILRQKYPSAVDDFTGVPVEKWPDILRSNLVARTVRRTNIIELVYNSRDPSAAESVISAVVEAYLAFIDQNHKSLSAEIVKILHLERRQVELALGEKQRELLQLKRRTRDFGGNDDVRTMHPELRRVVQLNETLIEVQKERLHLQASLSAVREAVRSGKDLRQHLVSLDPNVGDRLISEALGLNPEFRDMTNAVERQLMRDQAQLKTLRAHLGPRHPRVVRLDESIRLGKSHQRDYQSKINHHLNELQFDYYLKWAREFYHSVEGCVSAIDGDIYHQWHGDGQHRK